MSAYDPRAAGALCDNCPLNRKRVVPPEGPPDAELVILGEGPGQHEEKSRRPFVGPSGQLLNDLLREVGLSRQRVFISNSILCRVEVPGLKGSKRYNLDTYVAWLRAENAKRKKAAKQNKQPYSEIASPIDCCRPRLMRELKWFEAQAHRRGEPNGAVVIPMGNYALNAVSGKKGVMKWRGSPLPVQLTPTGPVVLDASGQAPTGAYEPAS